MGVLDKFSMKSKVSIVTGGAQGLGKAMAQALAGAGSDIVLAEVNLPLARETSQMLEKDFGISTLVVKCDVSDPSDAQALVKTVLDRFGRIDVLINNAGICRHNPAENVPAKDWQAVLDINLSGVFYCAQAVGQAMIAQKSGSIINISSMSGVIVNTPQGQASYNASKAGVIHLTKSLACEWARHNIRVNTIAPGYMETDMTRPIFEKGGEWPDRWMSMTPMNRPGKPEELDGIVLYLASAASTYTTGGVFVVDGGYTAW